MVFFFMFLAAEQTQRLDDDDDGGSRSGRGDGNGSDNGVAADRPVEPFDAVAGETFVVVDAAQRVRRGRIEVFEKGLQDDG